MYRVALWHPELISHLFSVCTPFVPPAKEYFSLEATVKYKLPQFAYQIQLASGEVEKVISSKEQIRLFLNAMYGGRGSNGEIGFAPTRGIIFENLPKLGSASLLSQSVSGTRL